jgi:hypothetical protein
MHIRPDMVACAGFQRLLQLQPGRHYLHDCAF